MIRCFKLPFIAQHLTRVKSHHFWSERHRFGFKYFKFGIIVILYFHEEASKVMVNEFVQICNMLLVYDLIIKLKKKKMQIFIQSFTSQADPPEMA